jgi:hypothetical protein
MQNPSSPLTELQQGIALFNACTVAIGTILAASWAVFQFVLRQGTPDRPPVSELLQKDRLNKDDRKTISSRFLWLQGLVASLGVLLLISLFLSGYLWLATRPVGRQQITGLEISFTDLDLMNDEWAKNNPLFLPIAERLAEEGQEAEKKGAIKDWRLYKGESKPFGDYTGKSPTNVSK